LEGWYLIDATEITFSGDVNFAGKQVKAGSYRFYTIPSSSKWTVVLNSELGQWGYYEPNYELDVERVEVPVKSASDVSEQFTITLTSNGSAADLNMKWDQTEVTVPIQGL